jgi:hypothetical protein
MDIADPAEIDAAFERGEQHVGTAVVGLALHSEDFAEIAPRVERALYSADPKVRQLAFVAAGDTARRFGKLTPAIYRMLRGEGLGGAADTAIKDALTFIPFRDLPWWFKRTSLFLSVRNFLEARWLSLAALIDSCHDTLRKAISRRR